MKTPLSFLYLCSALALLVLPLPANATRVALVIGNASYEDRPLKNPVNDAQDLAAALTAAGFRVTLKKNLSADGMKESISEFGDALRRENDAGLFYFSGHGVQTAKGNYLLPVGRAFKREKEVELFAVEARSVLSEMQQAKNPLNILILDACRDSPLSSSERSIGSKGLARMDAPSGAVIAFATSPGRTASDNPTGRNGLYTKHLIAAINTPGLRLEDVFKRVGAAVERESYQAGGDQSPEEVMKLRTEQPFYFKSGPAGVSALRVDDLEREETLRQEWVHWQSRMKADFDRISDLKGSGSLLINAWERFLVTWSEDNPLTEEDDDLRGRARSMQKRARPEGTLDDYLFRGKARQ